MQLNEEGKLICSFCEKEISELKYSEYYQSDDSCKLMIIHRYCHKGMMAKQKGLVYECNACLSSGKIKVPYSDCGGYIHDSCPPHHAGKFNKCEACNGEGYLKDPLTEWGENNLIPVRAI